MPGLTPEFVEGAKATQFGGERANPSGRDVGVKPYSIQNMIRALASREIDLESKDALRELSKGKRSIAYAIALKSLSKAMQGDARHTEIALERTDGKVPQPITMQEIKDAMEGDIDVLNDRILAAAAEVEAESNKTANGQAQE